MNLEAKVLPARGILHSPPVSSKLIGSHARDVSDKYNLSFELSLSAAIVAVNIGTHACVDIKMPDGRIMPSTLNTTVVADPSSGKSFLSSIFTEEINLLQQTENEIYNERLSAFNLELDIWKKQKSALLKAAQDGFTGGECAISEEDEVAQMLQNQLYEELARHESKRPVKPKSARFTLEDSTEEYILHVLEESGFTSIVSNEAGILYKSRGFGMTEKYNAFHSGSPVLNHRKSKESTELVNVRCAVHQMTQPGMLQSYLNGRGMNARQNGSLARNLTFVIQTQNSPRITSCEVVLDHQEAFNARLREILLTARDMARCNNKIRSVMSFSKEAAEYWMRLKYEIELEKSPMGRFARVQDHAGRLPENVARLAANLQYFEAPDSDISIGILIDAINICMFSSDCFLTLFDPPPQDQQDAMDLNNWLTENLRSNGNVRFIPKNHIRQFCPNKLREKNRLNHALLSLAQGRFIGMLLHGKTQYIDLFPAAYCDQGMLVSMLGHPKLK